jgi:hypothetical protein
MTDAPARRPPRPGALTGHRRRAVVLGTVLVLLLAGAIVGVAASLRGPTTCEPADYRSTIKVAGGRSFGLTHDDVSRWTLVSAADATWRGRTHYAIELSGDSRVCLSGGTFIGTWPRDTSWKHMHGTGAIVLDGPRATVEDVTVRGYGDSIRMMENAGHFVVRRVHLSFSRDDCIENDWLLSGTVTGSLLDGCYNAFSARSYQDVPDGDDHVWTIRSSLVRLEPMPRTYHDDKPIPGTAGFFKWDKHGPQLVLKDNVFRADQDAGPVGLDIPQDKLKSCSGNTMVWLGKGRYPGHLPSCFKLTRDKAVWDKAVASWHEAHE